MGTELINQKNTQNVKYAGKPVSHTQKVKERYLRGISGCLLCVNLPVSLQLQLVVKWKDVITSVLPAFCC